jgi:hypothetical protein
LPVKSPQVAAEAAVVTSSAAALTETRNITSSQIAPLVIEGWLYSKIPRG